MRRCRTHTIQRSSRDIITSLAAIALLAGCNLAGCKKLGGGDEYGGARKAPTEDREFPWPPPQASATVNLTGPLLASHKPFASLGDANVVLQAALQQTGYAETSYYSVPDGFALASKLEQTDPDGPSRPEHDRWSIELQKMSRFSLGDYLRALFTANPGHYRIIVFIVTDVPVTQSSERLTVDEAIAWLRGGQQGLPPEIAQLPWTPATTCTALIYEFIREQQNPQPRVVVPGALGGMTHLKLAGTSGKTTPKLWSALGLPQ